MGRCVMVMLFVLLLTSGWGLSGAVSARAQESTPQATPPGEEIAPGVTFELVPASENPPSLYRLRLAPGASLLFADDPAISLVYVESGALSLVLDAAISDARSDADAAEAEADSTLELSGGDYLVLPPLVAGEIRNETEEPAAIMIAAITPQLIPAPATGTPVPES